MADMRDYEKLGLFYLGRLRDAAGPGTTDNLLLYDSKDLVTHAVCVGMTGSGKTGLCIDLLEEAAIDGFAQEGAGWLSHGGAGSMGRAGG